MKETTGLHIDPLDVSDDSVLASAYRVESAANQAARPGWVGIGSEARILGWRSDDGWTKHLVGAWEDSTLLGVAACLTAGDVPDTVWIFAWVHPEHQGRGIGAALVRDAETVLELDLQLPKLPPLPVADSYTISTYVNGIPEQFREQVGRIKGLVDAEAPNGELLWGETPVSPAAYANEMALWLAQGSTVIESIATNKDGDVAAWTCLVCSNSPDRPADIEGTLVLKKHRGHGLGFAVKSASLDAARTMGAARSVRTSSDDQNVWMRAINASLGFVPVETEVLFQKPVAAADSLSRHTRKHDE